MSIIVETSSDARTVQEHLPLNDRALAAAIERLDGELTTLVTVSVRGNELFVGGGGGRYTLTTLIEDGRSFALVGDPSATDEIQMIVGGQIIPQPRRYVVDCERALRVARYFARFGTHDPDEVWEEP